jgi:predicted nuclease of restriction endonuclease-like (RecB) superfamily
LVLSRDKKAIKELSEKGQLISKPIDTIKEPYVLDFLGLEEHQKYSESDLETAIINKLEHFLV